MNEQIDKSIKKFILLKIISSPLKFITNILLKRFNLFLIWRTGKAIGDQLLIAGFAKSIKTKNKSRCSIIVITRYPKLLSLSPWINKVLSPENIPFWYFIYYFLKIIEGERIIEYNFPYRKYGYNSFLEAFKSGLYKYLKEPPIWHAHVADRFEKSFFENFSGGIEKSNNKSAYKIIKKIRKKHPGFKIGIINPIVKTFYKSQNFWI